MPAISRPSMVAPKIHPYAKPHVSDHLVNVLKSRGVPYTTDTKTHLANSVIEVAALIVANWPKHQDTAGDQSEVSAMDVSLAEPSLADIEIATATVSGANVPCARQFVAEVLRRSRSPYALLQVTMYYLLRVRPVAAAGPRSSLPPVLRCGRRTFLAALMLAGKYLHDKNFRTNAWSKISGLSCSEINANELALLKALDWQLTLKPEVYSKWCNIVLNFAKPFPVVPLTVPATSEPCEPCDTIEPPTLLKTPVDPTLSPAASSTSDSEEDEAPTPVVMPNPPPNFITPSQSPSGPEASLPPLPGLSP